MNIKEVARISRVPAKTIRFYEEIGLVRVRRAGNGYRRFDERDLYKLAFIGRARGLGFSVADCRELLPSTRTETGQAPISSASPRPNSALLKQSSVSSKRCEGC